MLGDEGPPISQPKYQHRDLVILQGTKRVSRPVHKETPVSVLTVFNSSSSDTWVVLRGGKSGPDVVPTQVFCSIREKMHSHKLMQCKADQAPEGQVRERQRQRSAIVQKGAAGQRGEL